MTDDDVHGGSILIVDDAPENLRLLTLDIQMPEMSGLDVCRWFKQDERLRSIPVIRHEMQNR
ncbi:MAG: hypothetical protein PHU25_14555 [Deltaproteobacteria bacterium]|nr:hypothetical protein [Deltaproteobacteria bacterium]